MRHYLSLCCIFKNECEYLEEWLRFYDLVGVEHFYLYDNDSRDAYLPVLTPWLQAGRASLIGCCGHPAQMAVYRHCLQNFAGDSRWIAFLDIDEFLFSPRQRDLRTFLQPYESQAGVVANWVMFGAGGHQEKPPGLVTLNYLKRCELELNTLEPALRKSPPGDARDPRSYHPVCAHIKSIVNTRDVRDIGWSPHHFTYREGCVPVHANGTPVSGPFAPAVDVAALRVNHYFSRSWAEFQRKLQRGRSDTGQQYNFEEMLERNRLFDAVEDATIVPLGLQVQAAMQRGTS